jgi:hypothetical protein
MSQLVRDRLDALSMVGVCIPALLYRPRRMGSSVLERPAELVGSYDSQADSFLSAVMLQLVG